MKGELVFKYLTASHGSTAGGHDVTVALLYLSFSCIGFVIEPRKMLALWKLQ
jgi:hypothetical protein